MKVLLRFVVVCIIIGSTTLVLAKNGDNHMNESLLELLVRYFHYLATLLYKASRQHAFLTVLREEEAHRDAPVTLQPPIVFPTSNYALTPVKPQNYGNHLAAIPIFRSKGHIHAEEQILDRLDDLIAAFQRNGSEVAAIVLYTYLAPCQNCTQRIVAYFRSRRQVCHNIIVAYTESKKYINESYAAEMFHQNGIELRQISQSNFSLSSNTEILNFEGFIEVFFPHSKFMFTSHNEEEEEEEEEKGDELWEDKSRNKSKEHLSNDDKDEKCGKERMPPIVLWNHTDSDI